MHQCQRMQQNQCEFLLPNTGAISVNIYGKYSSHGYALRKQTSQAFPICSVAGKAMQRKCETSLKPCWLHLCCVQAHGDGAESQSTALFSSCAPTIHSMHCGTYPGMLCYRVKGTQASALLHSESYTSTCCSMDGARAFGCTGNFGIYGNSCPFLPQ